MNKKPIVIRGKEFPSISDACRYYGTYYGFVRSRINRGFTIEEALGVIPRLSVNMTPKHMIFLLPNLRVSSFAYEKDGINYFYCIYWGHMIVLDYNTICDLWIKKDTTDI